MRGIRSGGSPLEVSREAMNTGLVEMQFLSWLEGGGAFYITWGGGLSPYTFLPDHGQVTMMERISQPSSLRKSLKEFKL